MRIFTRLSVLVLALFIAIAPSFALAQTSGGGTTGGTTSGSSSGGGAGTTSGGAAGGTAGGTTTQSTTTTTENGTAFNWTWIVVGAIVLIVIIGVVAMSSNRGRTT